jgi:hypothetical protein
LSWAIRTRRSRLSSFRTGTVRTARITSRPPTASFANTSRPARRATNSAH